MAIKAQQVGEQAPAKGTQFSHMEAIFPGVVPTVVQERQPQAQEPAPATPVSGLYKPKFLANKAPPVVPSVSGDVVAVEEPDSGPATSAISQNPEDRQDPDFPDTGDVADVGAVEAQGEVAAEATVEAEPALDEYLAGIQAKTEQPVQQLEEVPPVGAVTVQQPIQSAARRRRSTSKTPGTSVALPDPHAVAIRTVPFVPAEGLMPKIEDVEESVRQRAKGLEAGFLALAEDLRYLKRMKRYVQLGYEASNQGWIEYLDQHLGIAYRTAMDHIAIVDAAEQAKIPLETVNAMGPSKARVLRQVPVEARPALAEYATHPLPDGHIPTHAETVAKAQELSGQPVVVIKRISFGWTEDKYETVTGLLKMASQMYEPDAQDRPDLAQAFYIMALKWSQLEAKSLNLREHIEFLREQFPMYDITVTNKAAGQG